MRLPSPPLLIVTDRRQVRAPLEDILATAFTAGCRWASLREKDLPASEQIALARALHRIAREHEALLTLHGTPELAHAAQVDGVHLAARSDAAAARRLLGPQALIGISVHAPAEAGALAPDAVDYLIAGPAFETASKPGYGPALGEAGIAAIAHAARMPVVAIGGIEADNLAAVLRAGATGIAVMGGVMRAADVRNAVADLLDALAA